MKERIALMGINDGQIPVMKEMLEHLGYEVCLAREVPYKDFVDARFRLKPDVVRPGYPEEASVEAMERHELMLTLPFHDEWGYDMVSYKETRVLQDDPKGIIDDIMELEPDLTIFCNIRGFAALIKTFDKYGIKNMLLGNEDLIKQELGEEFIARLAYAGLPYRA